MITLSKRYDKFRYHHCLIHLEEDFVHLTYHIVNTLIFFVVVSDKKYIVDNGLLHSMSSLHDSSLE